MNIKVAAFTVSEKWSNMNPNAAGGIFEVCRFFQFDNLCESLDRRFTCYVKPFLID